MQRVNKAGRTQRGNTASANASSFPQKASRNCPENILKRAQP